MSPLPSDSTEVLPPPFLSQLSSKQTTSAAHTIAFSRSLPLPVLRQDTPTRIHDNRILSTNGRGSRESGVALHGEGELDEFFLNHQNVLVQFHCRDQSPALRSPDH